MTEQHPESLTRHDPYINRAFNAIFGHEDNAALSRAFTVGLAVADPERPSAAPAKAPSSTPALPREPVTGDLIQGVDRDGDHFVGLYSEHDCPEHGIEQAVYLAVNDGVFVLPIEHVPGFIAWLESRVRKAANPDFMEGPA